MYVFFSQFLKCSEDSEIPNSIFYVCGLRYISFFETDFFSMKVLIFLASGILENGFCCLFSYEFIKFFGTELLF